MTDRFEFPDIYVILVGLILSVSALTWIVPAGAYERTVLPDGRESVVPAFGARSKLWALVSSS